MAATPQARLKRDTLSGSEGRHPPLHILFVHSHAAEVERCLQELDRVHFTVSAEMVVTPEEFSERLISHAYDLVVAEYPSPNWQETQALELLNRSKKQIPLIFVGRAIQRETVAEFITRGAYDCIEMGHIGHLPVAVHRALQEKALRDERDRAQNGLRHSEARYRALAGNLSSELLTWYLGNLSAFWACWVGCDRVKHLELSSRKPRVGLIQGLAESLENSRSMRRTEWGQGDTELIFGGFEIGGI